MMRFTRSYRGAMASNMPRTAFAFSSPCGNVSGIGESGIARMVRAGRGGTETSTGGGLAYSAVA